MAFDSKAYYKEWAKRNKDRRNAKRRERYEKEPAYKEREKKRVDAWQKENPEKVLETARNQRYRLKALGIKYVMSADQIASALETTRVWKRDNKDVLKGYQKKRRALITNGRVGRVSRKKAWAHSGGICGVCGEPIDRAIEYPDNMSLSYDHIIPLSKGGLHCQDNIQCVHRICNTKKRDHIL